MPIFFSENIYKKKTPLYALFAQYHHPNSVTTKNLDTTQTSQRIQTPPIVKKQNSTSMYRNAA